MDRLCEIMIWLSQRKHLWKELSIGRKIIGKVWNVMIELRYQLIKSTNITDSKTIHSQLPASQAPLFLRECPCFPLILCSLDIFCSAGVLISACVRGSLIAVLEGKLTCGMNRKLIKTSWSWLLTCDWKNGQLF